MQRLRQLTFASLEHDRKKRREIFPKRMNGLNPPGASGSPHCAGLSEGRQQGATAVSVAGDVARALRSAVLQSERPALCRGESGEGAERDNDPDFRRRLERRGLASLPFGRSGITCPMRRIGA